jgi:hypothetical protein
MTKKIFLLAALLIVIFTPITSYAQSQTREINISPFLQELEVAKGGQTKSEIAVTNNSDQSLAVSISTKDFLPGDRGEPLFVPDPEFNEVTFSLASWIKVDGGNQITLQPEETKKITYTVSPPQNSEQGTHYGAILFSYNGDQQLSGVGITQSVGTIVLVNYGEARSQGDVNFSVDHKLEFFTNKFLFTNLFSNTGNVHVKPKGEIQLKNIFGKVVGTTFVNRDGDNVLPKSDRTFISEWYPSNLSFGPYRASLVLNYGKEKLELRSEQIIWIFPIYILLIIVLLLIFILWYLLHGRHWHKRRIISRLEK